MGSGASALIDRYQISVTEEMKCYHEELQSQNKSDDEIHSALLAKFGHLVQEETKPSGEEKVSPAKSIQSIGSTDKKATAKGKGGSRRRSYGDDKIKRIEQKIKTPKTETKLLGSASTPVLESPKFDLDPIVDGSARDVSSLVVDSSPDSKDKIELMDSWDSVSDQPYCNICCMAFKSVSFLERHVKYSDLHSRNIKQKEILMPQSPLLEMKNEAVEREGHHYKLLYNGSKLFWRSQETLDIHVYHHIVPNCVEVISFHVKNHKELNRIYIDLTSLEATLQVEISLKCAQEREKLAKDKFASIDHAAIFADVQRKLITSYILAHLNLAGDGIEFATDTVGVLLTAPPAVMPLSVKRRRRTNSEEIETTIKDLQEDRNALCVATAKAERVASHVFEGVESFVAAKGRLVGLNLLRRRWKIAIQRVLNFLSKKKTISVLVAKGYICSPPVLNL